ncbi:hypothetical protein [Bradyrhizobium sp. 145]|nr:hypothetical protein [Bradyrhizobium sp. 145]MCK1521228.1 hypothetical protein [Bradyrhizobium sp. 17]MCK1687902.1 hypothetical protein [Bradyrhizobium sp. 145]
MSKQAKEVLEVDKLEAVAEGGRSRLAMSASAASVDVSCNVAERRYRPPA